jgi:hypothetical protein
MVYQIDGMTLRTHAVYPKDVSIPKAIKMCLIVLAFAFSVDFLVTDPIKVLLQAMGGVSLAGVFAWNY